MNELNKSELKIKLFESINKTALDNFGNNGFSNVEILTGSFESDELKKQLKGVNVVGIRSRTKLSQDILRKNNDLDVIGCFCIGTNQVDLDYAKSLGIPVFNSPFSNTRSVAELIIGEIIMLSRGIFNRSVNAHKGVWLKNAKDSYEIKGKTLGIVGYGNIGAQVSVLAESIGMNVIYYDVLNKLPIGNAKKIVSLHKLLSISDFVTLHVPGLPSTENLIGKEEFDAMKDGSFLLNLSRGNVVVIEELKKNLDSGKILGAAIDVFPVEPKSPNDKFISELQGNYNVIITPHIGGSTKEAQSNIGVEVSENLIKYINNGETMGSVNFPQISVPPKEKNMVRIQHIHQNIFGVLAELNKIFADDNINIVFQYLKTDEKIGYCIFDVEKIGDDTLEKLNNVKGTLKARIM